MSSEVPEQNSKKKDKKDKKKAEKAEKAEKMSAAQLESAYSPPVLPTPTDGLFGNLAVNMSRYKTQRDFVAFSQLSPDLHGEHVWVRGRVHNIRGKGKAAFVILRRGHLTAQLTLFASESCPKEMVKFAQKLSNESILDVYGKVQKLEQPAMSCSQKDIEIHVEKMYCVTVPVAPLPFTVTEAMVPPPRNEEEEKKAKEGLIVQVGQNVRLDNRTVDLRTPANHAIFKMQAGVGRYFREFLYNLDFVEIHSPKIIAGVSEGGAEVFRLGYFNTTACLAQSPQLYKQMASACGDLFKVFEVGPVFRAENSNTHRHLTEFTGLDFEMEIIEHYHEALKVLGDLFVYIFDRLNEKYADEMKTIGEQFPFEPLKYPRETLVLEFKEAVSMLRADGENMGDFDDFTTAQEKRLGKLVKAKFGTDFYIVDRYPLKVRPFYTMPAPDNPDYSNSYDVFLRGEEITSGAQRVHDVELLKTRATECKVPHDNIQSYIDSFKYAAPPHAGAGIGLERVVMLFLGLPNIRMTCMFPRDPARLTP